MVVYIVFPKLANKPLVDVALASMKECDET